MVAKSMNARADIRQIWFSERSLESIKDQNFETLPKEYQHHMPTHSTNPQTLNLSRVFNTWISLV